MIYRVLVTPFLMSPKPILGNTQVGTAIEYGRSMNKRELNPVIYVSYMAQHSVYRKEWS
jgi:hypothetical protein